MCFRPRSPGRPTVPGGAARRADRRGLPLAGADAIGSTNMNYFVKAVSNEQALLKLRAMIQELDAMIVEDLTGDGEDGIVGRVLQQAKDAVEDAIDLLDDE